MVKLGWLYSGVDRDSENDSRSRSGGRFRWASNSLFAFGNGGSTRAGFLPF